MCRYDEQTVHNTTIRKAVIQMRRIRELSCVPVSEGSKPLPLRLAILLAVVMNLGIVAASTHEPLVLMRLNYVWYLPVGLAAHWFGSQAGLLFGTAVGLLISAIIPRLHPGAVLHSGWLIGVVGFGFFGLIVGFTSDRYAVHEPEARRTRTQRRRQEVDATSSQHEFLRALSLSIDARDPYTRYHSDHVARYAMAVGRALELPGQQLLHLGWAGLLHDLGKVGVPERILHKPGPLTAEEMRIVRRHTLVSAQILEPVTVFSPIIPAVRGHHERWDGTGYPDGLKGQDIPLFARILAICDVYDALSSGRPYRSPWPRRKVIDYMVSGSGVLFDPDLVRVFMQVLPSLAVEQPSLIGDDVLVEIGQLYRAAAATCRA